MKCKMSYTTKIFSVAIVSTSIIFVVSLTFFAEYTSTIFLIFVPRFSQVLRVAQKVKRPLFRLTFYLLTH